MNSKEIWVTNSIQDFTTSYFDIFKDVVEQNWNSHIAVIQLSNISYQNIHSKRVNSYDTLTQHVEQNDDR